MWESSQCVLIKSFQNLITIPRRNPSSWSRGTNKHVTAGPLILSYLESKTGTKCTEAPNVERVGTSIKDVGGGSNDLFLHVGPVVRKAFSCGQFLSEKLLKFRAQKVCKTRSKDHTSSVGLCMQILIEHILPPRTWWVTAAAMLPQPSTNLGSL